MGSSTNFTSSTNFIGFAPPGFPTLVGSNIGPSPIMDIAMGSAVQDNPLDQVEDAKCQRNKFSSSNVSPAHDSTDDTTTSTVDLFNQARRLQ
ncbi:hypothetical protein V6N13_123084 [Hibiscus sabdariffa]